MDVHRARPRQLLPALAAGRPLPARRPELGDIEDDLREDSGTVCTATHRASIVVYDTGGQMYGNDVCQAIAASNGWTVN